MAADLGGEISGTRARPHRTEVNPNYTDHGSGTRQPAITNVNRSVGHGFGVMDTPDAGHSTTTRNHAIIIHDNRTSASNTNKITYAGQDPETDSVLVPPHLISPQSPNDNSEGPTKDRPASWKQRPVSRLLVWARHNFKIFAHFFVWITIPAAIICGVFASRHDGTMEAGFVVFGACMAVPTFILNYFSGVFEPRHAKECPV